MEIRVEVLLARNAVEVPVAVANGPVQTVSGHRSHSRSTTVVRPTSPTRPMRACPRTKRQPASTSTPTNQVGRLQPACRESRERRAAQNPLGRTRLLARKATALLAPAQRTSAGGHNRAVEKTRIATVPTGQARLTDSEGSAPVRRLRGRFEFLRSDQPMGGPRRADPAKARIRTVGHVARLAPRGPVGPVGSAPTMRRRLVEKVSNATADHWAAT